MKKQLSEFFQNGLGGELPELSSDQANQIVSGITSDSREVKPGYVFVAVAGGSQDGHLFVHQAARQGAVAVIGEKELEGSLPIPYLRVLDSRKALAALASAFYDNPSESLLMIGVTGTSGKTTTTYLIESILKAAGHQVGLIGTVNFRFGSKVFPSTHTTPGPVELQRLLSQMKGDGCTTVIMEVSSHALKQRRVDHIAFDAVAFLNLSPEHLDFHPDMEDYFKSKFILFTELADFAITRGKKPKGIVNRNDSYGLKLIQELSSQSPRGIEVHEFYSDLQLTAKLDGIEGEISGLLISSPMTGQFNCSNIAAAATLTQSLNIPPEFIQQGIKNLSGVPGRLERVENNCGVHIWVDYAHKPDALEKVLKTLRVMTDSQRLITVFGCGGDRDRNKRPLMGKIAVQGSDHVFITSDNPRTEDPMSIINEILTGVQGFKNYSVEVDRRSAIFAAIRWARSGDLVVIAGKGHEDYQILGTKKIHFDDREVVRDALLLFHH